MPMLADRGNLSTSSRWLQEMLMSTTDVPFRQALQLTLFHQARPAPTWEAMPIESRRLVEQLLARMLYEYAARRYGTAPHVEARDE